MKKLTCYIMGLNEEAFEYCSKEGRRPYYNTVLAWLAVSAMGAFSGFDIAHNFTSNTYLLIISAVIGCLFVAFVDYLFISRRNTGYLAAIFRFLFALIVTALAAVSALGLLFSSDIDNYIGNNVSTKVAVLDSTHQARIKALFADVNQMKQNVRGYHQEICLVEARRGYAGPIYQKKHLFCIKTRKTIQSTLQPIKKKARRLTERYKSKRNAALKYQAGLSQRYTALYKMVKNDPVKSILVITFFSILLLFDLQALVSKLSISKDDEYNSWLKKVKEDQLENKEITRKTSQHEEKMARIARAMNSRLSNENLLKHIKQTAKESFSRPMASDLINEAEELKELLVNYLGGYEIYHKMMAEVDNSNETVVDNKTTEDKTTKKHPVDGYSVFYMTLQMKKIADKLWVEANRKDDTYHRLVFNWMQKNIEYNTDHTKEFYMTAREVFNSKMGVCGESTILYGAFLQYKNQEWFYCHVDVDNKGKKVNHACSLVLNNNKEVLVDHAYSTFAITHSKWHKVSKDKLIKNMISWNK